MTTKLIEKLRLQRLSVGILSANWLDFRKELTVLQENGLNILHFDVADGQFCPMFTVGASAIKSFSSDYFKDVHLLVKDQWAVSQSAVASGANLVTLQLEQQDNLMETLEWLGLQHNLYQGKSYPVLRGLSFCPETPLSLLADYVEKVDVFQVLTLDPRTGQKAPKERILEIINALQQSLSDRRSQKLINVDGSMSLALADYLRTQSNVDWIVSGSALFADNLAVSLAKWKEMKIF